MDIILLKNLCDALEVALSKADEALFLIQRNTEDGVYGDLGGDKISDDDDMVLNYHIERCGTMLSIALDGLGFSETRNKFLDTWKVFEHEGLHKVRVIGEVDAIISDALNYLHNVHDGLKTFLHSPKLTIDEYLFNRLLAILRDTPMLLRQRGIVPNRELAIQAIMHDYLKAFFPEFVLNPQISGPIRNFIPDCGIRNLSVAIEFKFASSLEEAKRALSGIFEDIAGYSGSKDWTRFIAVIYQTEAFESESRFQAELNRVQTSAWIPILVTGGGARIKKS